LARCHLRTVFDATLAEVGRLRRLRDALNVEHEIQRVMLERLGIEWTPGEPFYSLIEAEIERYAAAADHYDQKLAEAESEIKRLQAELAEEHAKYLGLKLNRDVHVRQENELRAEVERLRAALREIYTRPDHAKDIAKAALSEPADV
jgi:chromosome segregation ATPase